MSYKETALALLSAFRSSQESHRKSLEASDSLATALETLLRNSPESEESSSTMDSIQEASVVEESPVESTLVESIPESLIVEESPVVESTPEPSVIPESPTESEISNFLSHLRSMMEQSSHCVEETKEEVQIESASSTEDEFEEAASLNFIPKLVAEEVDGSDMEDFTDPGAPRLSAEEKALKFFELELSSSTEVGEARKDLPEEAPKTVGSVTPTEDLPEPKKTSVAELVSFMFDMKETTEKYVRKAEKNMIDLRASIEESKEELRWKTEADAEVLRIQREIDKQDADSYVASKIQEAEALIEVRKKEAETEIENRREIFRRHIQEETDRCGDMMENLLYWTETLHDERSELLRTQRDLSKQLALAELRAETLYQILSSLRTLSRDFVFEHLDRNKPNYKGLKTLFTSIRDVTIRNGSISTPEGIRPLLDSLIDILIDIREVGATKNSKGDKRQAHDELMASFTRILNEDIPEQVASVKNQIKSEIFKGKKKLMESQQKEADAVFEEFAADIKKQAEIDRLKKESKTPSSTKESDIAEFDAFFEAFGTEDVFEDSEATPETPTTKIVKIDDDAFMEFAAAIEEDKVRRKNNPNASSSSYQNVINLNKLAKSKKVKKSSK